MQGQNNASAGTETPIIPHTDIPARSLAKAKEWSLVLISQGIESTIVPADAVGNWLLRVNSGEAGDALKALKLYQKENPRRPWTTNFLGESPSFDWSCIVWVVICILFHWLGANNPGWLTFGGMDSGRALSGQWWRLITALFLHADLAHLFQNMGIGFVLMGLVMGMYGRGTALLGALFTGIAGNWFSLLLNAKPFHGLGASGLIMGCLGLIATASWMPLWRHPSAPARKWVLTAAGSGVGLFILLGLSPGTDIFAHAGGFISGLILGILHGWLPSRMKKSGLISSFNGLLAVIIVIGAWWLAWSRKGG